MLKAYLDALRGAFPNAKMYFKQGNHDDRLERYLMVKAPELYGMADFEIDAIAEFGARGIEYIKDKRTVKAGKLNILHGHELKGGLIPPVNVARGIYLRTNDNTVVGHWHRTSHHQEKDINGNVTSCWSVGCLSELNPEYMPNNRWNHGFAFITVGDDGTFDIENKMIIKGKVH